MKVEGCCSLHVYTFLYLLLSRYARIHLIPVPKIPSSNNGFVSFMLFKEQDRNAPCLQTVIFFFWNGLHAKCILVMDGMARDVKANTNSYFSTFTI